MFRVSVPGKPDVVVEAVGIGGTAREINFRWDGGQRLSHQACDTFFRSTLQTKDDKQILVMDLAPDDPLTVKVSAKTGAFVAQTVFRGPDGVARMCNLQKVTIDADVRLDGTVDVRAVEAVGSFTKDGQTTMFSRLLTPSPAFVASLNVLSLL